ncbi:hypothetical protein D3C85_1792980 [compost metagenome]
MKLVDQISVRTMNLHRIKSGIYRSPRPFPVSGNHLCNTFTGKRQRSLGTFIEWNGRRGYRRICIERFPSGMP